VRTADVAMGVATIRCGWRPLAQPRISLTGVSRRRGRVRKVRERRRIAQPKLVLIWTAPFEWLDRGACPAEARVDSGQPAFELFDKEQLACPAEARADWGSQPSRFVLRRGSLRLTRERRLASPMPASWNQITKWLRLLEGLRRAC
jgi:hypothetical protein